MTVHFLEYFEQLYGAFHYLNSNHMIDTGYIEQPLFGGFGGFDKMGEGGQTWLIYDNDGDMLVITFVGSSPVHDPDFNPGDWIVDSLTPDGDIYLVERTRDFSKVREIINYCTGATK